MSPAQDGRYRAAALPDTRGWTIVGARQRWSALRGDHLVMNSVFLFASSGAMGGFGFLFWIVNARLFTPSQVGVATTLISATVLISYAAQLGFNTSLVRFLPRSTDPDEEVSTGLVLVFGAAIILSVAYLAIVPSIVPELSSIRGSALYFAGFAVFTAVNAVNLVTDAVFVARRSAFYNFVVDGVVQGAVKLSLPVALVGMGAFGIFAASGLAAAIAVALSIQILKSRFRMHIRLRVSGQVVRRVFRFAGSNYVANLLNLMPILLLPVIVLHVRGASQAAYFYIAYQVANLLFSLAFSVSSSLFAEGSHHETSLRSIAVRAARIETFTIVPLTALLIVGSGSLLSVFGGHYSGAARSLLVILALSAPAVAFCTITVALLRLTGQLHALVLTNLLYAVTMCGLAATWAHRGLAWVGAAWLIGNLACGTTGAAALLRGPRHRDEGVLGSAMVPQ